MKKKRTDSPVSWYTLPFWGRGFFWVDGHEQRLQAVRSQRNDRSDQEWIKHSLCICRSLLSASLFSSPFCAAPRRRVASSFTAPLFHRGKRKDGGRAMKQTSTNRMKGRWNLAAFEQTLTLSGAPPHPSPSLLFSFFASFLFSASIFTFLGLKGHFLSLWWQCHPPLTPVTESRAPSDHTHCLPATTASSSFFLTLTHSLSVCLLQPSAQQQSCERSGLNHCLRGRGEAVQGLREKCIHPSHLFSPIK